MYDTWGTHFDYFSISGTFDCHTEKKLEMIVKMLKDMKFVITEYPYKIFHREIKLWVSWTTGGEKFTGFATENHHFKTSQVPSIDTITRLFKLLKLYNVYVTISIDDTKKNDSRFLEGLFDLEGVKSSGGYYIRIYEGFTAILEYKKNKRACLIKPENKSILLDTVARYLYNNFYFKRVSNVSDRKQSV